MRRLNFEVTGGSIAVQKELNESALKPRPLTGVEGEARAAHLNTSFKINEFKALGKVPMRNRILGQGPVGAPLRYHFVVFCGLPAGYRFVGHVG